MSQHYSNNNNAITLVLQNDTNVEEIKLQAALKNNLDLSES